MTTAPPPGFKPTNELLITKEELTRCLWVLLSEQQNLVVPVLRKSEVEAIQVRIVQLGAELFETKQQFLETKNEETKIKLTFKGRHLQSAFNSLHNRYNDYISSGKQLVDLNLAIKYTIQNLQHVNNALLVS